MTHEFRTTPSKLECVLLTLHLQHSDAPGAIIRIRVRVRVRVRVDGFPFPLTLTLTLTLTPFLLTLHLITAGLSLWG